MKHKCISRMGAALSATALFVLPLVSFADVLPALAVAKFNVILTANAFKNAVAVGPGTTEQSAPITLGWDATGAKGCIGNWSAEPLSSVRGTLIGTIPLKVGSTPVASRTFTIVCFGIGTAKSAKVTVTLAKADLSVPKLTISGLKPVTRTVGAKVVAVKNTYEAGTAAYSLAATVKNGGKLKADAVVVTYQQTQTPGNSGSWTRLASGVATVPTINPGAVQTTSALSFPAAPQPTIRYYFRACADVTDSIVEMNENNNCSRPIGPFIFATQQ